MVAFFKPGGQLEVENDRAYLLTRQLEGFDVRVYDISRPENPALITNQFFPMDLHDYQGDLHDFQVEEGILYISPSNQIGTILIIDATDPVNMLSLGSLNVQLPRAQHFEVEDHLLLAGDNHSLTIFDLSNPAEPSLIATLQNDQDDFLRFAVEDSLLVTKNYDFWDLSNPANPQRMSASAINDNQFIPQGKFRAPLKIQ